MNKLIKFGIALLLPLLLLSCEKETEGVSFETHYPILEVKGDNPLYISLGTTFTEPGIIAMAGTEEAKVETDQDIDINNVGYYTINYTATNKDGFQATATRAVIVYNPNITGNIEGDYSAAPGTYRLRSGATVNYSGYSVNLVKVAPGIFYVSDYFAGYYDQRAGYGSEYAMTGYLSLNQDNSLTLLYSHVNGWGDSLEDIANGKYDPVTSSIYWEASYGGSMTFYVTLK
jgi:hypothetical protein